MNVYPNVMRKNQYFVSNDDWPEMLTWLCTHHSDWLQESWSTMGVAFSIRDNVEWFTLRWL